MLSNDEILKLSRKILPTVRFEDILKYIKPVDVFSVSYTWDPQPTTEAKNLKPSIIIPTNHYFGYVGLFKPSIAEVIVCIPPELLETVVAFEIVDWPKDIYECRKQQSCIDAGYHQAQTQLYTK